MGRVVCEPEPRWPGRDEPVVTGPRESLLSSAEACVKQVGGNAHRHKKNLVGQVRVAQCVEASGRTPMRKNTRVGYGCCDIGNSREKILGRAKRKISTVRLPVFPSYQFLCDAPF